jgi:hypothetical protein
MRNNAEYSMNDIYPFTSKVVPTTEQTIPDSEERKQYSEQTVSVDGKMVTTNNPNILIGMGLLVGALILINSIGGGE